MYSLWAQQTDFGGNDGCKGCTSPCQNGGTCSAGFGGIQCSCQPGYLGPFCEIDFNPCRSSPCPSDQTCINGFNTYSCTSLVAPSSKCPSGFGLIGNSQTNCSMCQAGTTSVNDQCIPCQKGTYSNQAGASSLQNCTFCQSGSFSSTLGSTKCDSCSPNANCTDGSVSAMQTSSLQSTDFTIQIMQGENIFESPSAINPYWPIYLYVFIGVCVIVTLPTLLLRKKTRRLINASASFLVVPWDILRLDLFKSDLPTIEETPSHIFLKQPISFFRGLIGMWVATGIVLTTIYQFHTYFAFNLSELGSIQPGLVFSSGILALSATTSFNFNITLLQTPVNCDESAFLITWIPNGISGISGGGNNGEKPICTPSSQDPTTIYLTFQLNSVGLQEICSITILVKSLDGSSVFSQGIIFDTSATMFKGRNAQMDQIVRSPSQGPLGDVQFLFSSLPTEYIDVSEASSYGYSFQYAETIPSAADLSNTQETILINLDVPAYHYQVLLLQAVSPLQLIINLFSLAGTVITVGGIVASHGRPILVWILEKMGKKVKSEERKEDLNKKEFEMDI